MTEMPRLRPFLRSGDETYLGTDALRWCVLRKEIFTIHTVNGPANKTYRPEGGSLQYWAVTTPNSDMIPKVVLGGRMIRARKDGRYGLEDRTIHPQYYSTRFEYICCIPQRPADPKHSLGFLWFTPKPSDTDYESGCAFNVPITRLKSKYIELFRKHRVHYKELCREYEKRKGHSELLGLLETTMCHCFTKVSAVPMMMKDLTLAVAELQRAMLDIHAFLDYMMVFYPRLFPKPEDRDKPIVPDHSRMGAFTEEPLVAEQLRQMGLPVWLLRPVALIPGDTNVLLESSEEVPDHLVLEGWETEPGWELEGPFPVIYRGPPGMEMNRATQRIGCIFMDLIEVSRIGLVDVNDVIFEPHPSGKGVIPQDSTPTPVQASTSVPASVSQPAWTSLPAAKSTKSGKFGKPGKVAQAPADRFQEPQDARMPPSVPAWEEALRNVDRSLSRMVKHPNGAIGFRFPDPRTFLASQHSTVYMACPTFFKQLDVAGAIAEDARSTPSVSSKGSKNKRKREVPTYLTEHPLMRSRPDQIHFHEEIIMLGDEDQLKRDLSPEVSAEVLWELFEHNFRFELLTLDKTLAPLMWAGTSQDGFPMKATRDVMVRKVFAGDDETDGSYLVEKIPTKDVGLAARNWFDRMPHVHALACLMSAWKGCPYEISRCERNMRESQLLQMERLVAQFYCQCFFDYFGRAAIVPHRIPRRMRKANLSTEGASSATSAGSS
ncbi:hypothetical protein Hypma_005864 [Hypsizygus marmoreus]|uniref:Uncharacterized protein n=1 Tax=Hypsizygus marmoreus TaxID=39966 RepID=A0A369KIM1_HYPMA|nr:hypothetical protein Hypma_005864 [Hypsizygus marmoreus]